MLAVPADRHVGRLLLRSIALRIGDRVVSSVIEQVGPLGLDEHIHAAAGIFHRALDLKDDILPLRGMHSQRRLTLYLIHQIVIDKELTPRSNIAYIHRNSPRYPLLIPAPSRV